jgi:hypothetical protein
MLKNTRKARFSVRRKCPDCGNWITKKTKYVLMLDAIIIALMITFFFRVSIFFILLLVFIPFLPTYILYAPYQKAKIIFPDGYGRKIVEGQDNKD